jgi:soluble lytic murein transglycosylase-like protein
MQLENRHKRVHVGVLFAAASFFLLMPKASRAQIVTDTNLDGRKIFVNAEPPTLVKLKDLNNAPKQPKGIYLTSGAPVGGGGEISYMNRNRRPDLSVGRDDVEKMVSEAAERHHVDPALVRAVIQTESNWNPAARSRKGALGLMQLIPTTAVRFGVNDAYNPQQNVDAGVHYLRTLLERYNGNLDLALAAYNAGEGAVDRAHGVPAYRETRDYVQKVQNAYFSPGSGRMSSAFVKPRAIHRDVDANGRTIFTNE